MAVGLANGTNRNNAIEIVGFTKSLSLVCRTVFEGSVTETSVTLPTPPSLLSFYQYEIVAKSDVVKFYVNGSLVATHTTTIPTIELNAFFLTSHTGPSNGTNTDAPQIIIRNVTFKQRPQ